MCIRDRLNNPGSIADFTTKIEIQQPLINLDALYQRKAAAKQMEVYGYKTQRTRQYLAFETQSAFLQLQLAYDALAAVSYTHLDVYKRQVQFWPLSRS